MAEVHPAERLGFRLDFKVAVEDEIRRAEQGLGQGNAKDWTAYQATVEQIKAFKRCVKLFDSVWARYVEEDERDDMRSADDER